MSQKIKISEYKYILLSTLFFCLPLRSQNLPVVTIGIVLDGPWDQNQAIVSLIKREIIDLTENEFDIRLEMEYIYWVDE